MALISKQKETREEKERQLMLVQMVLMASIFIWMVVGVFLDDLVKVPGIFEMRVQPITYFGTIILGFLLTLTLIWHTFVTDDRLPRILQIAIALRLISLLVSYLFADSKAIAMVGNNHTCEGLLAEIMVLAILVSGYRIYHYKYKNYGKILLMIILVLLVLECAVSALETYAGFAPSCNSAKDYRAAFGTRSYGTMYNPNPFGQYLAMALTAMIVWFLYAKTKAEKIWSLILAALSAFTLMIAETRAGMVGVAGAAVVFLIFFAVNMIRTKKNEKKEPGTNNASDCNGASDFKAIVNENNTINLGKRIGVMLLAMLLVLGVTQLATGSVENILDRNESDTENGFTESMGSGRRPIWDTAWEEFLQNGKTIAIGEGESNFIRIVIPEGENFFETNKMQETGMAHNYYLDLLVTQGVLGLATYLFLIITCIVLTILENGGEKTKIVYTVSFAVLAYMITDVFSWHILTMTPYFYFVLSIGIGQKMKHD